jgi:uncharacterized protein (TIGR02271 family)
MSPDTDNPVVISSSGIRGYIESDPKHRPGESDQVLVNFETGQRLWVPPEALLLHEAGHYELQIGMAELEQQHSRPTILARPPVFDTQLAEAAQVQAGAQAPLGGQVVPEDASDTQPTGVTDQDLQARDGEGDTDGSINLVKIIQTIREELPGTVLREDVTVQRVPINEYVDATPPIRYEDDTVIIPVMEEVLVVQKRLLLREEVVVRKRQATDTELHATVREREDIQVVPQIGTAPQAGSSYEAAMRQHHANHYGAEAKGFEYFRAAYEFGRSLAATQRFGKRQWSAIEPDVGRLWEELNPGTWQEVLPAVAKGFDLTRTA